MESARALALLKLKDGRYDDLWNIPAALAEEYPDEPFILFWPWEDELICFLTGRWDRFLEPARWQRDFGTGFSGKTGPRDDQFRRELWELFVFRRTAIDEALSHADLEPFQSGFLRLSFADMLYRADLPDSPTMDDVNGLAEAWLRSYPMISRSR